MSWVGFMCVIIGLQWFRKFTTISMGWGGYRLDFPSSPMSMPDFFAIQNGRASAQTDASALGSPARPNRKE
jgi:hypothetical protein